MYLTGESYAGQYVPNIANWILTKMDGKLNLRGLALGNACWGGTADSVVCNGVNSNQNDVDMYFGKGLVSKPTYENVYKVCNFPFIDAACTVAIEKAFAEVGPHNV